MHIALSPVLSSQAGGLSREEHGTWNMDGGNTKKRGNGIDTHLHNGRFILKGELCFGSKSIIKVQKIFKCSLLHHAQLHFRTLLLHLDGITEDKMSLQNEPNPHQKVSGNHTHTKHEDRPLEVRRVHVLA